MYIYIYIHIVLHWSLTIVQKHCFINIACVDLKLNEQRIFIEPLCIKMLSVLFLPMRKYRVINGGTQDQGAQSHQETCGVKVYTPLDASILFLNN